MGSAGDNGAGTTTLGFAGAAGAFSEGDNILTNHSFEDGWTGWTVDPQASQNNHARVKWPQPGSYTPDGEPEEYLVGTWHETDAYVVNVYQSLDDLDDGPYALRGFFNWGGPVNSVELFARNCGSDDIYQEVQPTADTQWREVVIIGIDVVGGHCEVGFKIDAEIQGWCNADLFGFFEMDPQ